MTNDQMTTHFLTPQRSSIEAIQGKHAHFMHETALRGVLEDAPNLVVILDANRQIVYANTAACIAFGCTGQESVLGKRVGEALGCIHSNQTPSGCGTSESCRFCGAAIAQAGALNGTASTEECRMLSTSTGREEALDLRVWAKPIEIDGQDYLYFSGTDIVEEKQKQFLERIFLHDILNTASALKGFSNLLGMDGVSLTKTDMIQRIGFLSSRIVEEINAHRQLLAAESNELVTQLRAVRTSTILEQLVRSLDNPESLKGRRIKFDKAVSADVDMITDPTLLLRVLGNMTKNALEASNDAGLVTIECTESTDRVLFRVHNDTCMPESVRLQVFNRSFSTKGVGRGLGTYSMKFLTENYLDGTIAFSSSAQAGTTFTVSYPKQLAKVIENVKI